MSITSIDQKYPDLDEADVLALVDVFELLLKWDEASLGLIDTQECGDVKRVSDLVD